MDTSPSSAVSLSPYRFLFFSLLVALFLMVGFFLVRFLFFSDRVIEMTDLPSNLSTLPPLTFSLNASLNAS